MGLLQEYGGMEMGDAWIPQGWNFFLLREPGDDALEIMHTGTLQTFWCKS